MKYPQQWSEGVNSRYGYIFYWPKDKYLYQTNEYIHFVARWKVRPKIVLWRRCKSLIINILCVMLSVLIYGAALAIWIFVLLGGSFEIDMQTWHISAHLNQIHLPIKHYYHG